MKRIAPIAAVLASLVLIAVSFAACQIDTDVDDYLDELGVTEVNENGVTEPVTEQDTSVYGIIAGIVKDYAPEGYAVGKIDGCEDDMLVFLRSRVTEDGNTVKYLEFQRINSDGTMWAGNIDIVDGTKLFVDGETGMLAIYTAEQSSGEFKCKLLSYNETEKTVWYDFSDAPVADLVNGNYGEEVVFLPADDLSGLEVFKAL